MEENRVMFEQLPQVWANYMSMAGFAILGLLVWIIPASRILEGVEDRAPWRDLRWWASLLIVIQIGIYVIFN